MLSHVSLGVANLALSRAFYRAVLETLGYVEVWAFEDAAGYGAPGGNDQLAIFERSANDRPLPAGDGFHLALKAPDRDAVDRFFAAALRHGGRDAGPPGPRPHYGDSYYAAFVLDPDGHKLEAKHA